MNIVPDGQVFRANLNDTLEFGAFQFRAERLTPGEGAACRQLILDRAEPLEVSCPLS